MKNLFTAALIWFTISCSISYGQQVNVVPATVWIPYTSVSYVPVATTTYQPLTVGYYVYNFVPSVQMVPSYQIIPQQKPCWFKSYRETYIYPPVYNNYGFYYHR